MSDENGADSAPEVSVVPDQGTPEVEATETQTEGLGEDADDEEYEFEGKKRRIPKAWREAMMKNADYTQKTQSLAEERKAVESHRERIKEVEAFWDSAPEEFVSLKGERAAVERQLSAYKDVNWVQLFQNDPQAQEHRLHYESLKDRKDGLERELAGKYQAISAQRDQDLAKRLTDTEDYARTSIRGWSKDVDRQILELAEAEGISKDWLRRNINPTVYKFLHKAWLGSKAQQVQTNAQAKPAPQLAAVPPTPSPNRAATPLRKDPSRMSMDEFAAWRKAGGGR